MNVFGDEFEVEDFDAVVDGHRPSDHDREGGDDDHESVAEQSIRTVSAHYAPGPVSPIVSTRPSRNSTRKSRSGPGGGMAANPFASPEDADESAPSLSFEPEAAFAGHRSVSSASSAQFARTGSQRFGGGPSHPYGMYPQGTIPRSPSIATQSTVRPSHRHSSSLRQNGPQHPYTLYPQGVSEDIDDEDDLPQNPVPVGFPGLGQSYQRRLGPDGEEQDIIGEDGHTEQLPPYSRYPEDGPEKVPLLVPEAPRALHSRAPVAGTDPTMALMHEPLLPTPTPRPQSMTDASSLREGRPPSMANIERMRSDGTSYDEKKSWSEKSWKEKRKTKVLGCIPLWWILLAIGVLTFIVAVLGGVIGGFMEGAKKHHVPFESAKSSLWDASAIATPATITPPSGTYQLSLSTPQATQASCLTEPNQQAAWSCDLAGPPTEAIAVTTENNTLGAFLFYASSGGSIVYGAQTSFMETQFAPFITVTDNDDPNRGPAYYFAQMYDKLVVVPENALTATSGKKRQIQLDQGWFQQKQVAQAGDKPWFCVWNNTFVEGFIYVQQPIVESYYATTTAAASTANATAMSSTKTTGSLPVTASASSATPTDYITTVITEPSTTATFAGPSSVFSYWSAHEAARASVQANGQGQGDDDGDGDKSTSHNKRNEKRQNWPGMYDSYSLYPYVVKIEERRLEGNTVNPYCQQYQILDDGGYNWVADSNGDAIMVQLQENDPAYSAYQSAGIAGDKKRQSGSDGNVGGCHCQWMSGQG